MNVERPLDLLNNFKLNKKKVVVEKKGGIIKGFLVAFDIHINLVIETDDGPTFIRGDVVETVSPCV